MHIFFYFVFNVKQIIENLYNITQIRFYICLFCDRLNCHSMATLRLLSHLTSKYKGTSSMDCRERWSHALGVYPTQYTSKGEIRRRSRHQNHSNRVVRNLEEKNVSTKGKSPKQGLNSANDLTIELSEGRARSPTVYQTNQLT